MRCGITYVESEKLKFINTEEKSHCGGIGVGIEGGLEKESKLSAML